VERRRGSDGEWVVAGRESGGEWVVVFCQLGCCLGWRLNLGDW
jgi:hypothetical protein